MGDTIINNLCFADDFCLMTTSIFALKALLRICEEYSNEHAIIFNPSKTHCMAFLPRKLSLPLPELKLCGKILGWCSAVKYLGYDVSNTDTDIAELNRRRREIYMRASLIRNKFVMCSESVKKYLFQTFFGTVYCMSLWNPTRISYIEKVKVAYNDAFRMLFRLKRRGSISEQFMMQEIDSFYAMYRKTVYSLLRRVATSDNDIVCSIYNSSVFRHSSLYLRWCKLLLGHQRDPEEFIDTFDWQLQSETYMLDNDYQDEPGTGFSTDEGCGLGQLGLDTF